MLLHWTGPIPQTRILPCQDAFKLLALNCLFFTCSSGWAASPSMLGIGDLILLSYNHMFDFGSKSSMESILPCAQNRRSKFNNVQDTMWNFCIRCRSTTFFQENRCHWPFWFAADLQHMVIFRRSSSQQLKVNVQMGKQVPQHIKKSLVEQNAVRKMRVLTW